MNPYLNEEVMWQRLKDIQQEAENARLWRQRGGAYTLHMMRLLGERVWWLAGLATRRPPRRPARLIDDREPAKHAA